MSQMDPTSAPTAQPTPETPSASFADADAAALAVLSAGGEPETAPAAPPVAPAAPVEGPAAAPPSPIDALGQASPFGQDPIPPSPTQADIVMRRLVEQERELVELRRRANDGFQSDEERALARRLLEARKQAPTNPEVWFREAGWTPETIQAYIANGGKSAPLAPALDEVRREFAPLREELQATKAELAAMRQEVVEREFKSAIPQYIQAKAEDYPYLNGYFESPQQAAEQIFTVIKHAHTTEKRSLTVAEAAASIERVLSENAEKFARVKKPATPTPQAPAIAAPAKPSPVTLTNQATGSSTPAPDPTDFTALDKLALKQWEESIRALKAQA